MRPASGLLGEVQQARARAAEAERLVEQARRLAAAPGLSVLRLCEEEYEVVSRTGIDEPYDPTLAAAIEARPSLDDLLRGE